MGQRRGGTDFDMPPPTAANQTNHLSRAHFLKRSAFGGITVLLGGAALLSYAPKRAHSAPSAKRDAEIFNFALLLEYLEDGFYADAIGKGALTGELLEFARKVGKHEKAHVALLQEALGDAARERPAFDFGDATSGSDRFTEAALALEETGTAAYIGQGANLTLSAAVTAGRIASVEGRHTAWIRDIARRHPAPHAADRALSQEEVSKRVDAMGFVAP